MRPVGRSGELEDCLYSSSSSNTFFSKDSVAVALFVYQGVLVNVLLVVPNDVALR